MSHGSTRTVRTAVVLLAAAVLGPGVLRAQTGAIAGQVTAASTPEPLAGAQVFIEALGLGALSDENGRYQLAEVPTGTHQVQVTYLGYQTMTREVAVGAGETAQVDFDLTATAIDLDEIVITGTGAPTQRRQLGQTINAVDAAELEVAPVTSVTDALQGRIPGMTGASLGEAGAGARIRLRGTVSLSQRNEPVIYIDGVRLDNSFNEVAGISTSRLNDLDPSNIERIEVLKGAAAATLFGTEASSGVIQIFTKRGMVSDPVYSFRMDQGISSIDAEDRVPRNWGYDPDSNEILSNHPARDYIKPAWQQQYSLSVRGGTPGVRYYASGRVADQPGSMPNNGVENYSLRTALDFQHTSKLTSSIDVNLTRNSILAPYPTWGLFGEFTLADPTNTSPERPYGEQDFTVAGALDFTTTEVTDNRVISGGLEYTWLPDIRSSVQVGVNDVNLEETVFIAKGGGSPTSPSPGERAVTNRKVTNWTIDFRNNASIQISDGIQSSTVVGAQSFWETTVQQNVGVTNFPSAALRTLRGGSTVTNVDEFQEEVINAGVFVQEQLGFGNRLFVTGGLRMDGNSAFGEDFGFQLYPKAGASWVVSEESFWNMDALNQVRLRAAYGTSGLQPGAFDAQRTWQPVSGLENQQAVLPLNLGNEDLKPERSQELELAVELAALDGRIGAEAVYFDQTTTDALLPATVSPSLGFLQSQLMNIGALKSSGVELSGNLTVLEGSEFALSLDGSYSWIDQVVTDMGGVPAFRVEGRRRWSQIREGYAPGAVIAPVHDPDDPWYTTVPIEEVTSASQIQPNWLKASNGTDSLVYIGDSTPTWTATFGATAELPSNLTARALFRGEGGFIISNETELIRQNLGYNRFRAELDRALDPAAGVSLERKTELIEQYAMRHPNMFSDWMEVADYIKLQEVSLTWQLPTGFTSDWGLGETSVTLNSRNLALWTRFSGIIDPGAGRGGRSEFLQNIDYLAGPTPRYFGLSVQTSIR